MIDREKTILITGAQGMVGQETVKLFKASGFNSILTPSRTELDLLDKDAVFKYFSTNKPHYLLMIAAKVGGISANIKNPIAFTVENLTIELNLFEACDKYGIEKNLFVGSSCIYPKGIDNRLIKEEDLLQGTLEPTNEGYALSKIVGLKLADYYFREDKFLTVSPMFSNIYGTGDSFDFNHAHVLSSLVRRFIDARDFGDEEITLWGTGIARREFLHVEDAANSILFFMDNVNTSNHINVGWGLDISISELAEKIAIFTNFTGNIKWDPSKPNGMLKKCLDVSKIATLGFKPCVTLNDGIKRTIAEYENIKHNYRVM